MTLRANTARRLTAAVLLLAGCRGTAPVVTPAPPPTLPRTPEPPVARVWSPREEFVRLADSLLAQPAFATAQWGALIIDPESQDTIYAHQPRKLFVPASNQKLITGAVALSTLGATHRFRTTIAHSGTVRRGTLRGNLLITGDGDPSISQFAQGGDALRGFDPLIAALTARGVRRIEGALVAEGDALPGPTTGYAWEADDLDGPSGAAIDELFFNEGEFHVIVRGGARVGQLVTVRTTPLTRYPRLRVEARTAAAPVPRSALTVGWDSTATVVVVSGSLEPEVERTITLAYRHPADAWRAAATEALARAGITVTGRPATRRDTTTTPLVTLEGRPFADVLARMEKPSQNQMAELLYRAIGRAAGGGADSAQRAVERQLTAWGVRPDEVVVRDGSGLSRHNFVSPTTMVRVLDAMRRHPDATLFRDALAIAGRDGTIASRMKGTPAEGNVRAKTGTLDRVRSLSGYVTTPDGRVLLFSLLCNHFTTPTREVDRVVDTLLARLAVLRLERRE